mgnify:CR=1 FL=1
MTSLRKDNPALWAEFTAHIRDVVGDWTDDQIAAVASKVRARSPGALMDSIAEVFVYCGAVEAEWQRLTTLRAARRALEEQER